MYFRHALACVGRFIRSDLREGIIPQQPVNVTQKHFSVGQEIRLRRSRIFNDVVEAVLDMILGQESLDRSSPNPKRGGDLPHGCSAVSKLHDPASVEHDATTT